MNKIIRSRAPLRLGLAGGGTDVTPFSEKYGGAVLNATIDLYAQVILEPAFDNKISFIASDMAEILTFDSVSALPINNKLPLHCGVYNSIVKKYNNGLPLSFKMTTFSDAPAGSGLGTSSTMVVAILKAFDEWLGLSINEYDLAKMAYEIERLDLGFSGGKQDQYAACFGGFNFMEFGPGDSVLVNPLRVNKWIINELESSTVLFYTGTSRDSAQIIEEQINQSKDEHSQAFSSMVTLKRDAYLMKSAVLVGDFKEYSDVLNSSWLNKKKLAKSVTNDFLDEIYETAFNCGCIAGKLSGAGGGGFFNFFVSPKNRIELINGLSRYPGKVINFNFENSGVASWKCNNSLLILK